MFGGNIKSFARKFLPKAIRPYSILSGPLRGMRLVTSWHDYPAAILGRTEHALLQWFANHLKQGETWLDVGSHYGYTALALCRLVGKQGRVFAFEPMVSTAGYLAQTRLLNELSQLTVLPLALTLPESFELRQLPSVRGMVDSTLRTAPWQETILACRLDWLWTRICGQDSRIHGIKIDVQGMEIEALYGMLDTLRSHHPKLIIEIHHGVSRETLLSVLDTAGYDKRPIAIEPVSGKEDELLDDHSYVFTASGNADSSSDH
mgnify:FL=1